MSTPGIFEVFVQGKPGDVYEHVGEVGAADPHTALLAAKEHFARRDKCAGLWVVNRKDVHAAPWSAAVLSAGNQKMYRRSLGNGNDADVLQGRV